MINSFERDLQFIARQNERKKRKEKNKTNGSESYIGDTRESRISLNMPSNAQHSNDEDLKTILLVVMMMHDSTMDILY